MAGDIKAVIAEIDGSGAEPGADEEESISQPPPDSPFPLVLEVLAGAIEGILIIPSIRPSNLNFFAFFLFQ